MLQDELWLGCAWHSASHPGALEGEGGVHLVVAAKSLWPPKVGAAGEALCGDSAAELARDVPDPPSGVLLEEECDLVGSSCQGFGALGGLCLGILDGCYHGLSDIDGAALDDGGELGLALPPADEVAGAGKEAADKCLDLDCGGGSGVRRWGILRLGEECEDFVLGAHRRLLEGDGWSAAAGEAAGLGCLARLDHLVDVENPLGCDGSVSFVYVEPVAGRHEVAQLGGLAVNDEAALEVCSAVQALEVLCGVGLKGFAGEGLAVLVHRPPEDTLLGLARGDAGEEGDVAGAALEELYASKPGRVEACIEEVLLARACLSLGGRGAATSLTEVGSVGLGCEFLPAGVRLAALHARVSPHKHLRADAVPLLLVQGEAVGLQEREHRPEGAHPHGLHILLEGEAHIDLGCGSHLLVRNG